MIINKNKLFYMKKNVGYYRRNLIKFDKKKNKAFVLMAAQYGNLGDVAITIAQIEFLERLLPNYEIYPIYIFNHSASIYRKIKKSMRSTDIITLIGGGNFGDLYSSFQLERNFIISKFKTNVISFPQTIDFTDKSQTNELLNESKKIIEKNKPILFIREKNSFDYYKHIFKTKTLLVPDIVLSSKKLKISEKNINRKKKIITLLRNDEEKNIPDLFDEIDLFTKVNDFELSTRDTHVEGEFENFIDLEIKLSNMLEEISHCQLVITDRLHGMIFCYLTNTPCLFFDNTNKKVSGVFEWIKGCGYIKQADIKNLKEDMQKMISKDYLEKDISNEIDINFNSLKEELLNISEGFRG